MIKDRGIIILGAGGHGKSIVSVAMNSSITVSGIFDDDPEWQGKTILGIPVYGPVSESRRFPDAPAVIGIGANDLRRQLAETMETARFSQLICKTAYIAKSAVIRSGTVIFPLAVIGAEVEIGKHAIISAHVTIGHDSIVEDYVHIAPGSQIAGNVQIGQGAMIGIGATVCPGIRIGENAVVAAGAVVVRDVAPGSLVSGVPAKARPRNCNASLSE